MQTLGQSILYSINCIFNIAVYHWFSYFSHDPDADFWKTAITSSQNVYLLRINIFISLFVTIILTLAVKNIHEFYKNKNTLNNNEIVQNIEYIYRLIDEQKINEAKNALISLKSHIIEHWFVYTKLYHSMNHIILYLTNHIPSAIILTAIPASIILNE